MSNLICITNRNLCLDFLTQIEKIAKAKPKAIILREQDLSDEEYTNLYLKVKEITTKYNVPVIINSYYKVAEQLRVKIVHIPLPILKNLSIEQKTKFDIIGTSCHSVEDAITATNLGCKYLLAGHIFATDCKREVEPRGLDFLQNITNATSLPVFAIGGINEDNYNLTIDNGASGYCIMSGLMQAKNVEKYISKFK